MNREYLLKMDADGLDGYARMLGISTRGAKTAEAKVRLIEERRAKRARINVLGVDVEVPVKRYHDRDVVERYNAATTDEDYAALVVELLGDEQWAEVVRAATDEDGHVDQEALNWAMVQVVTDKELKNF